MTGITRLLYAMILGFGRKAFFQFSAKADFSFCRVVTFVAGIGVIAFLPRIYCIIDIVYFTHAYLYLKLLRFRNTAVNLHCRNGTLGFTLKTLPIRFRMFAEKFPVVVLLKIP